MPSLDTIRTVRVRGQTDGVDAATAALNKLSASIQAANDNLMRTGVAAKEASDGWSITGEGALSAANRLRQAAEARPMRSRRRSVASSMISPCPR